MTQYARPTSDVAQANWTDAGTVDNDGNLYTSIDETTLDNDDSYITNSTGGGDTAIVGLSSVTDPASSSNHVVHCWFRSIGSGAGEKLDVSLYQSTTYIAGVTNQSNRSGTYADATFTLTAVQADSITNYSALRIHIIANTVGGTEEIRVSQAYLEVPDAPAVVEGVAALSGTGALSAIGQAIVPPLYPSVAAQNTSYHSTATSTHTVSLPTGITAGDLLIVMMAIDAAGAPITSFPAGWTEIKDATSSLGFITLAVAYRIADGNEGSTISVTTTSSAQSAHASYRITDHDGAAFPPEISTGQSGDGQLQSPDNLSPTGGDGDYLWVAMTAVDGSGATGPWGVASAPPNYTNLISRTSGSAADGSTVGVARRKKSGTSEDPGNFTVGDIGGKEYLACTLAVYALSAIVGYPALSGTGALSAIGQVVTGAVTGVAQLSGTGALSAIAEVRVIGAATITGTGGLSAIGVLVIPAQASLSGTGGLSAIGTVIGAVKEGIASLSGAGVLSAQGIVRVLGQAPLAGAGSLSAQADVFVIASAPLSGTGALTAIADIVAFGVANLSGTGSLSAIADLFIQGSTTLSGTGGLSATGDLFVLGATTLSGTGSLSAIGEIMGAVFGVATLSGTGALSAVAVMTKFGVTTLPGTGLLSAIGEIPGAVQGAASLSGTGTLQASASLQIFAQAALSGTGNLSGIPTILVLGQTSLTGTGDLSGIGAVYKLAVASLSGSGDLVVTPNLYIIGVAPLSGLGSLTAQSLMIRSLIAALAGSGDASAIGNVLAGLAVVGKATLSGVGSLVAIIALYRTPDEQKYFISTEDRTLQVKYASRSFSVPLQDRTASINYESRAYTLPAETKVLEG